MYIHVYDFQERAGFPNVGGAVDGTYIPITGTTTFRDSFICRKGFPAIQLHAVCHSSLKFQDVFCAYPGSVHDARVYRNSPLFEEVQELCMGKEGLQVTPTCRTNSLSYDINLFSQFKSYAFVSLELKKSCSNF